MTGFAERIDAISLQSLRNRRSVKWSVPGPDGYGAFIAEMDFGAARAITEALVRLAHDAEFGYLPDPFVDELRVACAAWHHDHYGWDVAPDSVHPIPDVLAGLQLTITHFSRPGTPVIVPTPAYMPFLFVPGFVGRDVIQVPMREADGFFTFDLDGIDAAFRAGGEVLVLCNPYNPVGRVFDTDELRAVTDVVDRHGGRVFADEIHAPLVYPGSRHVPYASTSDTAARHTITATSASKGWNLPGLKCAQVVLSNDADRDVWSGIGAWAQHDTSIAGTVANTAAYRDGATWLGDVVTYLDGSRTLLATLVSEYLPGVRYRPPNGTYLAWLDFRAIALPTSPGKFVTEQARVFVVDGPEFGDSGAGSVRLTFATPRPILRDMLERMGSAVRNAR